MWWASAVPLRRRSRNRLTLPGNSACLGGDRLSPGRRTGFRSELARVPPSAAAVAGKHRLARRFDFDRATEAGGRIGRGSLFHDGAVREQLSYSECLSMTIASEVAFDRQLAPLRPLRVQRARASFEPAPFPPNSGGTSA